MRDLVQFLAIGEEDADDDANDEDEEDEETMNIREPLFWLLFYDRICDYFQKKKTLILPWLVLICIIFIEFVNYLP